MEIPIPNYENQREFFSRFITLTYRNVRVQGHPEEFENIDEILEFFVQKYPTSLPKIEELQQNLQNQSFNPEDLTNIAHLIEAYIIGSFDSKQTQSILFALSLEPNPFQDVMTLRIKKLKQLQELSESYEVNLDPTILNKRRDIREKITSFLTKKVSNNHILNHIFLKRIARKPFIEFTIHSLEQILNQQHFGDYFDEQKSRILLHRELISLLEKPKKLNQFITIMEHHPEREFFISPNLHLSSKDYKKLIILIKYGTEGALTYTEKAPQGQLSLSDQHGALTQVDKD